MKTTTSIEMDKDKAEQIDQHYCTGFFEAIRNAYLAAEKAGIERVFIVVQEKVARVY